MLLSYKNYNVWKIVKHAGGFTIITMIMMINFHV